MKVNDETLAVVVGIMAVSATVGGNVAVVVVAVGYFMGGWSWLTVAVAFVAVAVAVSVLAGIGAVAAFVAVASAIGGNFQPRDEDGRFVPVFQNGKRREDVLIPRRKREK